MPDMVSDLRSLMDSHGERRNRGLIGGPGPARYSRYRKFGLGSVLSADPWGEIFRLRLGMFAGDSRDWTGSRENWQRLRRGVPE